MNSSGEKTSAGELADLIEQAIHVKLQLSETGAEILSSKNKALLVSTLRTPHPGRGGK